MKPKTTTFHIKHEDCNDIRVIGRILGQILDGELCGTLPASEVDSILISVDDNSAGTSVTRNLCDHLDRYRDQFPGMIYWDRDGDNVYLEISDYCVRY